MADDEAAVSASEELEVPDVIRPDEQDGRETADEDGVLARARDVTSHALPAPRPERARFVNFCNIATATSSSRLAIGAGCLARLGATPDFHHGLLTDHDELEGPDRADGLIVTFILSHDRRADRAGRKRDQHV